AAVFESSGLRSEVRERRRNSKRRDLLRLCYTFIGIEKVLTDARKRIQAAAKLTAAAVISHSDDRPSSEDDVRDETDQELMMIDELGTMEQAIAALCLIFSYFL
ncbi:hypothetical protein PENTCL1PPCAC_10933, partial [Pristionchus entomophagus]